jgi:hypothetical protein
VLAVPKFDTLGRSVPVAGTPEPTRIDWVSGMDFDPAGTRLAMVTLTQAHLYTRQPGESWAAALPSGDASGEVWHLGRHQVGLTVRELGDGLLLALGRPPSDKWPRGGTQLTLTTYGLDDAAFADLEARWTEWWTERFDKRDPSPEDGCV